MRRRLPSCLAVVVLLTGCGGSTSEGPAADRAGGDRAAAVRRPPRVEDVLLITIDTLRADALGYAGRDDVATPTIDRLAASGVVFTNAQAHNVVTLPSHANILTGLLPYEHGVRDNTGFTLPESIGSAATYFSRAGFATAAVVGAAALVTIGGVGVAVRAGSDLVATRAAVAILVAAALFWTTANLSVYLAERRWVGTFQSLLLLAPLAILWVAPRWPEGLPLRTLAGTAVVAVYLIVMFRLGALSRGELLYVWSLRRAPGSER